jgi:hypothetical protein
MRIYIAGMYSNDAGPLNGRLFTEMMNDQERADRLALTNLLESYHYVKKQERVDKMRNDKMSVFMDSGAFSAFTLGEVIDLKAYCDYIKTNQDVILCASVLDGIGDPLLTYQNQCAMEAQGVRPLPCFHWGEDERYLEHYVANYEYITLGGMVPHSTAENKLWLDRIWEKYLCDSLGKPKLKVHGFGMTSIPLMLRYPWFSVDSSSWVQVGFRGGIILPEMGVFHVSDTSPARKVEGQHFTTISPFHQAAVRAAVEKRGYTIERLASVYVSRWIFNAASFRIMQEELATKELTFKPEQIGIF